MKRVFVIADLHLSFGVNKPMDIFGTAWTDHASRLRENWNSIVDKDDIVIVPGDLSWGLHENEVVPDLAFINDLSGEKILMKGNHELWWGSLTKLKILREKSGFKTLHFMYNNAYYLADRDIIICGTRFWKCPGDEGAPAPDDEKILAREAIRFGLSLEAGKTLRNSYLTGKPYDRETVIFGDDVTEEEKRQRLECTPEIVPFFHYPPVNRNRDDSVLTAALERENVKRVYFGHIHGAGRAKYEDGSMLPFFVKNGISCYLTSADFLELTPREILAK